MLWSSREAPNWDLGALEAFKISSWELGLQVGLLEGLWDTKLASWSAWGLQVGSQGLQVELLKALWAAK